MKLGKGYKGGFLGGKLQMVNKHEKMFKLTYREMKDITLYPSDQEKQLKQLILIAAKDGGKV